MTQTLQDGPNRENMGSPLNVIHTPDNTLGIVDEEPSDERDTEPNIPPNEANVHKQVTVERK